MHNQFNFFSLFTFDWLLLRFLKSIGSHFYDPFTLQAIMTSICTKRDQFEHVISCVTAILDSAVLALTVDRWHSRFGMLILIVKHILIMFIRSYVFRHAVVSFIDILV